MPKAKLCFISQGVGEEECSAGSGEVEKRRSVEEISYTSQLLYSSTYKLINSYTYQLLLFCNSSTIYFLEVYPRIAVDGPRYVRFPIVRLGDDRGSQ